jgi:hypothetical protein
MLTNPIEYSIPITPDTAVKMALNLSTKTIYYVDDNGIIQIVGSVASNSGVFNNVTITGGTIQGVALTLDSLDNTPIGSNTPSTGRFTTLTTTGLASFNSMSTANVTITGGTIQGVAMTLDSLDNTPIGSNTPSTGKFTTLGATGVITSTLANGTAPFSVVSSTVVPNLNVSQLLGNTWAVPGTIGSTTPNSGAFTILSANSVTNVTPVLNFNASNTIAAFGSTTANSYNQLIIQNKSGTSSSSANYVISNDIGTDSTYYGEFGMNSSVFSASTPSDFFSINNGVYFSGHDGDLTYGSGNGFKSYFAWGVTANSAHVINTSGAIGLSTNLGTTPALSGTTGFGTAGQVMISNGSGAANSWSSTPTLVGTNFTGIPNGALTNSSITFGSTAVALGATVSGFNGVNIGATTAGTGAFTTLSASSTVSGTGFSTYLASPPAIGSTTPNTGAFTTVTASSTVSGAGFSTYLASPPAIGSTTPNTGSFTSLTDSGNLTFTGTGNRILGDYSNATFSSRTSFQTSTTNGTTGIYALPNGTGTAASWQATNAADPTNASKILITTNGSTDVQLVSGINGTGTYLPMGFWNNGAEKARLSVAGGFSVGTTTDAGATNILAAGTITGTNIIPNGSSAPTNGMFLPATNSVGFSTASTERMRIDGTGNVSVTQSPGKYTVDTAGGATVIANGGTVDFPNASGMLIVNTYSIGAVTIWLCGGGNTNSVSNVGGVVGSFAYVSGINGYRWTNNSGSTATFGFFFVRTRNFG